MQAEADVFGAVVDRLGLSGAVAFTDQQKLAIYRQWKVLVSIPVEDAGNGSYRFDYVAQPATGAAVGTHTIGTISATGEIVIASQEAAGEPNCPICLARGTPIDTPAGPMPVESLLIGDPVWTLDALGRRVAGAVIAIGSTNAPAGHEIVRVQLADGRSVTASPGHPLADGTRVGDLRVGDWLDGAAIVTVTRLAYRGGETFDIAVSGPTGIYFAGGIPLASTLEDDGEAATR
jgi:hypothetical protein